MADVVHHVGRTEDESSGIGFMLTMVLVVALILLLFFWALPQLGGSLGQTGTSNNPAAGTTQY